MSSTNLASAPRVAGWLISAAISLTTTKYLLDRRLHYPMHLLVLQLSAALAFKLVQSALEKLTALSKREGPAVTWPRLNKHAMYSMLYTLCFSLGIVCAYEALHHTPNVPVVVIAGSLGSLSTRTNSKAPRGTGCHVECTVPAIMRILIAFIGSFMLFIFDFRISATSFIMMIVSLIAFHLAQKFLLNAHEAKDEMQSGLSSNFILSFISGVQGLVGALVAAGVWSYFREPNFRRFMGAYNPLAYNLDILALNLVSSGLAFGMGRNVFGLWETPARSNDQTKSTVNRTLSFAISTALVTLVSLGSIICRPRVPYAMSPWQWLGYIILMAALLPRVDRETVEYMPVAASNKATPVSPHDDEDLSERQSLLAIAHAEANATNSYSLLGIVVMVLLSLTILNLRVSPGHTSQLATLDNAFQPSSALEIVISRYDEPASKLAAHITKVLAQPSVGPLEPTFRIYNKNEASDDSMLFLAELDEHFTSMRPRPRLLVHTLENVGREADTFLAHITTQWDHLANHTIFMQADPHAEAQMLQLIRDSFVPETGFVALSHPHTANKGFCKSCDDCYDRDWTEDSTLLSALFSDFNPETDCKDMLLSYRGQFIASAARIRGSQRDMYTKWLNELRDPKGRLHTPPYTDSKLSLKLDSMAAPRAGFTFERMWPSIMQCHGRRIAERCPTWMSSVISPAGRVELGDCQCLD